MLAKLETGKALFEFNPIIEQADGIVLSRGNLNLDVRPEKFALIQKAIVSKCNIAGKPILVTRMLDSMTQTSNAARFSSLAFISSYILHGCAFLGFHQ